MLSLPRRLPFLFHFLAGLLAVLAPGRAPAAAPAAEPLRPKVVVVAMFEVGKDTGDTPGEYQFWVEREKLDRVIPLPAGFRDVRTNADGSVLGILTGVGNTSSATSIMALGLDPRFDLSKSYWLVAGIAGIDPADGSIGAAAWADFVVEGDLGHEIDAREIPADWPTGYVPLRAHRPYEAAAPDQPTTPGQVFELNPGLVEWAFQLTKDMPLADNPQMQARRATYTGFPAAQLPPRVQKGATISSSTYWHGRLLDQWANDWVRYHTGGRGNYVTTAMEDTGTLHALTALTRAGRADVRRVLVLRTASNFDMQWPGGTAAESMNGEKLGLYSAYLPSLEAAYGVGSRVVHTLLADWARYEAEPPAAKP
ncbi:MAG: purine nucleoside permease [Opitutae bacterium]|nr:purine nucleoside permease [Opitutae bacterium]